MLLDRGFEQRDALIGFAALLQRLRLEPRQPEVARVVASPALATSIAARVFLGRDVRLRQIAGDRRVFWRELARILERRNRLVELSGLLIRERQVRQQQTEIERRIGLAAILGNHRRQRIDDRLILPAFLERLGQRVVAPRTLRALRNHLPRGGFRLVVRAEPALGLRQQIQRAAARVGRGTADDFGQRVARLAEVVATAGIQQRRRVAELQLDAARRALNRTAVRTGSLRPAMLTFVKVRQRRQQSRILGAALLEHRDAVRNATGARIRLGEHHRTVLPAGLLVDQIVQQRDRLLIRAAADIQPRQRRAHVRIGFRDRAVDRGFEVAESPWRRSDRARRCATRAASPPPRARRRWCRARGSLRDCQARS